MLKYLILTPLLFSLSAAAATDLVCKKAKDSWGVFNVKTGKFLGSMMADEEGKEFCEGFIENRSQSLVCTYDMENEMYVLTRITDGKSIGEYGTEDLNTCYALAKEASKKLVCNFADGDTFRVFRISDGRALGPSGIPSMAECQAAIKTEKNGLFCQNTGSVDGAFQYKSIKVSTNQVYGYPFNTGAPSLEECDIQIKDFELNADGSERDISAQTKELTKLFVDDFRPFVKTLSRKVNFYSYYDREELKLPAGPVDVNSQEVRKRLQVWAKSFKDLIPFETGWVGFGLYGAANPVDSQEFASDDWILSEISIPKGKKFFDMRLTQEDQEYNYAFHFTDKTKKKVNQLCNLTDENYFETDFELGKRKYTGSIGKTLLAKNRICREALTGALEALEVSFLTYNWYYVKQQKVRKYNACDTDETPAAVFVDSSFSGMTIKAFSESGNPKHKDEYRRIFELAKQVTASPTASWPDYKDSTAKRINVDQELEYVFGCKEKYKEDRSVLDL